MSPLRNQLSNAGESNLADIYLMCKIGEKIQFVLLMRPWLSTFNYTQPNSIYCAKIPRQNALWDCGSRTAGRRQPWIPRYLVTPAPAPGILRRRKLWHRDATPILLQC